MMRYKKTYPVLLLLLFLSSILKAQNEREFLDYECVRRIDSEKFYYHFDNRNAVCHIIDTRPDPNLNQSKFPPAECTGTLINNTSADGKMYVLTAAHCLPTEAGIDSNGEQIDISLSDINAINARLNNYAFDFFYYRENCEFLPEDDPNYNRSLNNIPPVLRLTGARLISLYYTANTTPGGPILYSDYANLLIKDIDIALLEITQIPDFNICPANNLYFSGWNASKRPDVISQVEYDAYENYVLTRNDDDDDDESISDQFNEFNNFDGGIVIGHPNGFPGKVAGPNEFYPNKHYLLESDKVRIATLRYNMNSNLLPTFQAKMIGGFSGSGMIDNKKRLFGVLQTNNRRSTDQGVCGILNAIWTDRWNTQWFNQLPPHNDLELTSIPLSYFLDPTRTNNTFTLDGAYPSELGIGTTLPDWQQNPNIRRNLEITENITGDQFGNMVARETIKAEGATIEQGADIDMIAGDYTEFKTGFKVEKGARLLVENGNIKGVGCADVCSLVENQDTYSIENGELYGHVSGADFVETYFTVGGSVLSNGEKPVIGNDRVALLDIYKAFGNSGAGIYDVEAHYTNACDELIVNYEVVIDQKDIDDFSSDYYEYADDILDIGKYLDNKVLLTNHYQVGEDYNPSSSSVIAEDVMFEIDVVTDIPYAKTHGFEWSFRDNESYGGREFFNPAIVTSEFEVQEKLDLGTLEENTLKMDVYYPKLQQGVNISDAPSLPLLIYLFGGGFVKNANPELGEKVCEWLATKGYVVAAIDYRIGMDPFEGELAKRAVVRAWQDMEAAVKYWRIKPWNFSTQNPWKIDPDKIYGLGWSAGGITVLHNQYLSRTQYSDARSNQFGYLWSSTGNYQFNEDTEVWTTYDLDNYPTTPCTSLSETPCTLSNTDVELIAQTSGVANKAVSFAGAIGKDQWMLNSNNPTTDIHHSRDRVVSINYKAPFTYLGSLVNAFDILNASPKLSPIYGGGAMDIFATGNNQKNYYLLELNDATQAGGIGLMENYHFPQVKFESIMSQVRTFPRVEPKIMFYVDAFFSGVGTDNGSINSRSNIKKTLSLTNTTADDNKVSIDYNNPLIYPNPTSGDAINVKFQVPYTTEMTFTWFDLTGRKLAITSQELKAGSQHIVLDVSKLPNGVFALQVTGGDINASSKVVIHRD